MDDTRPNSDTPAQRSAIGYVVDQLLESIAPELANAVRLGAIPHWFDQQLLGELAGGNLDSEQVQEDLEYFLIGRNIGQQQFAYHDEVRNYLIDWWRRERPQQYVAVNRTALEYFAAQAEKATSPQRPTYELEVLYHLLIVDEAAGIDYLSIQFEDVCAHYQRGLAERFVAHAAKLRHVLTDRGRMWVQYFEARLDFIYQRNDAGEAIFRNLASSASDRVLQAVARWSLGGILINQQRWSQAIQLYHESLQLLQRERAPMYSIQIMRALGDVYRDLAGSSSGFPEETSRSISPASQLLYFLQHLPFILYDQLVRRVRFLPNWYGTNYQNWIIAYLLVEAIGWYRRSEQQIKAASRKAWLGSENSYVLGLEQQLKHERDTLGQIQIQMWMADIEHQLGHWYRSRHRYELLLKKKQITASLYRIAQVQAGQGRAFLEEGDLIQAREILSRAFDTFRHFFDDRSSGETAVLLARTYTALGQRDEAITAYIASIEAFEAVHDHVARTQSVWALEALPQRFTLSEEQRRRIASAATQVVERHYVTRFSDTVLRRFRSLALLGALPLTYVLMFIISLAWLLSLWIVESSVTLDVSTNPYKIADITILVALAVLPVPLILWLHGLIYGLTGLALVRVFGRWLILVERDQPNEIVINDAGLTHHPGNGAKSRTIAWPQVVAFATMDYYQRKRPIRLISRAILAPRSEILVVIDAITAGYDSLKRDIVRHLKQQSPDVRQQQLDFTFFDSFWMAVATLVSLVCAFLLRVHVTAIRIGSNVEIQMQLTSIILSFVLMMAFLFPTVALWRLIIYRMRAQRMLGYQLPSAVPLWMLWLATTFFSIILILWIVRRMFDT